MSSKDKSDNVLKCVNEIYDHKLEDDTEYYKKLPYVFDEKFAKKFLACSKKYKIKINFLYVLLFKHKTLAKCPYAKFWGITDHKLK